MPTPINIIENGKKWVKYADVKMSKEEWDRRHSGTLNDALSNAKALVEQTTYDKTDIKTIENLSNTMNSYDKQVDEILKNDNLRSEEKAAAINEITKKMETSIKGADMALNRGYTGHSINESIKTIANANLEQFRSKKNAEIKAVSDATQKTIAAAGQSDYNRGTQTVGGSGNAKLNTKLYGYYGYSSKDSMEEAYERYKDALTPSEFLNALEYARGKTNATNKNHYIDEYIKQMDYAHQKANSDITLKTGVKNETTTGEKTSPQLYDERESKIGLSLPTIKESKKDSNVQAAYQISNTQAENTIATNKGYNGARDAESIAQKYNIKTEDLFSLGKKDEAIKKLESAAKNKTQTSSPSNPAVGGINYNTDPRFSTPVSTTVSKNTPYDATKSLSDREKYAHETANRYGANYDTGSTKPTTTTSSSPKPTTKKPPTSSSSSGYKYANSIPSNAPSSQVKDNKPVTTKVVSDVMAGKYGAGQERAQALTDAGYDYRQVQTAVNKKIYGNDAPIAKMPNPKPTGSRSNR